MCIIEYRSLQAIDILAKLGVRVSSSTMSKQKQRFLQRQKDKIGTLMLKEKEELEESGKNDYQISCDIIGDNVDITRSPSLV